MGDAAQVRLTTDVTEWIDAQRAESGRSRAQEVNHQLVERSLDLADAELLGRADDEPRTVRRRSGRASVSRPMGRHRRR